jgi:hypothetical protein
MRKATVIYKTEDGYLTNGVKLLENISDEIEGFIDSQKLRFNGSNGHDFLKKYPTEVGNQHIIEEEVLELDNFFLVDKKYKSIDTGMKVIVELKIFVRESIVE